MSDNVASTFVVTPADPQKTLGIKLPFLVMIIKNLKKYFSFEVQVLDDKNVRRRFRASNYQVCNMLWSCLHVCLLKVYACFSYNIFNTCSRQQGSSHSFAPCPCDWMMVGTRSSSIFLTSPDERMVGPALQKPVYVVFIWTVCPPFQALTTLRRYEYRSMRTAESAGFTSLTGFTQKRSCLLSSSSSYPL